MLMGSQAVKSQGHVTNARRAPADECFVLAAAALWGTTGTAQAFALAGAAPLAVGAVRLAIGGVALLLLALVSGDSGRGDVGLWFRRWWRHWVWVWCCLGWAGWRGVIGSGFKLSGQAQGRGAIWALPMVEIS